MRDGIKISSHLTALIGIFDGTGGSLVGLDHVDVTLPDGTVIYNATVDGLGNFLLPNWTMQLGANVFQVSAYDSEGNSANATLTLYGTSGGEVPEPASAAAVWMLLGTLALALGYRRRKSA